MNQYEELGIITKAETIEELANTLEILVEALQSTLDTWNEAEKIKTIKPLGETRVWIMIYLKHFTMLLKLRQVSTIQWVD